MKKLFLLVCLMFVLSMVQGALAFNGSVYSGTYVDASTINTAPVDPIVDWWSTSVTADKWRFRDAYANAGIWESNGASPTGDKPMLAMTIGSLIPQIPYNLYVVQWSDPGYWRVMAGTEPDNLIVYGKTSGRATGAVESNRNEYEAMFGTKTSDAEGNLTVYIDDIPNYGRTWFDGVVYAPSPVAYNPNPAQNAKDVDKSVMFSWMMGRNISNPVDPNPAITGHYLYIVPDEPNFALATMVAVADLTDPIESGPYLLDANKTYYWRLDESINGSAADDPNTITGLVWSFETIKTKPSFDEPLGTQPQDAYAFIGNNAVLSVSAGTTGGEGGDINYQWYRGLPGDISSPLIDETDHIVGAATSELTIVTAITDQGTYYCQATNDAGSTDSMAANLVIKRLIAHYPFDNSLEDMVGDIDGILSAATYVEGKIGQAVSLNGTQVVDLGLNAAPNSDLGGGLDAGTVSMWINTTNSGTSYYTGTRNTDPDATSYRMQFSSSNSLGFVVANSADNQIGLAAAPNDNLRNGQWQMIVVTWDAKTGDVALYANGKLLSSQQDAPISGFNPWQNAMVIGAYNNQGTLQNFYIGAIDDYRVYNYALDGFEVAQLFIDQNPGTVICVEKPQYDFNDDCQIDLMDLVEMIESWLDCNIVSDNGCL